MPVDYTSFYMSFPIIGGKTHVGEGHILCVKLMLQIQGVGGKRLLNKCIEKEGSQKKTKKNQNNGSIQKIYKKRQFHYFIIGYFY